MRPKLKLFLPILLFTVPLFAQKGTASSGYFPYSYAGNTFTGTVSKIDGGTEEITLLYTKGAKTESFVGRFESGCSVPNKEGSPRKMTASDFPSGAVVRAYYRTGSRVIDGKKQEENRIIAVQFNSVNGKEVPAAKRFIYFCTEDKQLKFMAF